MACVSRWREGRRNLNDLRWHDVGHGTDNPFPPEFATNFHTSHETGRKIYRDANFSSCSAGWGRERTRLHPPGYNPVTRKPVAGSIICLTGGSS